MEEGEEERHPMYRYIPRKVFYSKGDVGRLMAESLFHSTEHLDKATATRLVLHKAQEIGAKYDYRLRVGESVQSRLDGLFANAHD